MVNVKSNHHAETPTNHPLRLWRKAHNRRVPLQQLAVSLGCTRAHLSLIEHYRLMPSLLLAYKIKVLTGLPIEDFVGPTQMRRSIAKDVKLADYDKNTRKAARERAAKTR